MSTREAALGLLETALDAALRLDPEALARLAPLHGRVIRVQVLGLGLDLWLVPGPAGIQVLGEHEGEPDFALAGPPLALARLARGGRGGDELLHGGVQARGDLDLGRRFQEVLAGLDLDWEEQLARLTGDVLAHQVGSGARAAGRWARDAAALLPGNVQEYLQEELRLLPTRIEARELADGVDRLRDDLARLEARLARLAAAAPLGAPAGGEGTAP